MQLVSTVEQCRTVDRQLQLGANQKRKTELVLEEVKKNDGSQQMFRSLGRMFVLCPADELTTDLNADIARLNSEAEKNTAMKTIYDGKKDQLTKQLNDLQPAPTQ